MRELPSSLGLVLPRRGRFREFDLRKFAAKITEIGNQVGLKLSSRGWCYQLEGFGVITKAQFDQAERLINECRKKGLIPIDFVTEEEARAFSGIEIPELETPQQYLKQYLQAALRAEEHYTPDWWDGEEYYIQMVVEKIDLKNFFEPVCKQYHVPVATSRGWASILQRAEYARRFKQAEERGLKCVLLYCGDHDPDGLRISEFLRSNLEELSEITWSDGLSGYDPSTLKIDRFGLNFDFIQANKLTWIDNLYTGAKQPCPICHLPKRLDDPHHPNFRLQYVQEYLKMYRARKCEANALVVRPKESQDLCRQAIERYLGPHALGRFESRRQRIRRTLLAFRKHTGLDKVLNGAIRIIEKEGSLGE